MPTQNCQLWCRRRTLLSLFLQKPVAGAEQVDRQRCLRGKHLHRFASQAAGFDVPILPAVDGRDCYADCVSELLLRHVEASPEQRSAGPMTAVATSSTSFA